MLALLVKIILYTLSAFVSLVSSLLFPTTARVLVLLIHALRVPGQAIQGVLEILRNVIKNGVGYFVEILVKAISNVISSLFDHLIQGVSVSAVSSASTIVESVGKVREVLERLFDDVPGFAEVCTNVISSLLENLFENYKDAIAYIVENAF